jgi:NADH dehydrogenase/NADH:ubiquinone oxidoreductase subunit G
MEPKKNILPKQSNEVSNKATKLVSGTINGEPISVAKETSILTAGRMHNIPIPTLCHHEGLPPDGACRLCIVNINNKLAVSCLYPLRNEGFVIETNSPEVREARRFILSLLINRAPKAPRIRALAEEYGAAYNPRFADDPDNCIRCGLCVRSCRINKIEAIALVGRGKNRLVTGPFLEPPVGCVGCLACAQNCPTGNIPFKDRDGIRSVWGREFVLIPCPDCGERIFTKEQLSLYGDPEGALCPSCKKRRMARSLKAAETFLVKDVIKFEGGRGDGDGR